MATGLEIKLNSILNEKITNCIPLNIKAGKSIFGVSGKAPITVSTVEELVANTNYPEDTFAIVYGTSYVGTYRLDNGTWTQIGDGTQNQQIMDVLNEVAASSDQYEGNGGTDAEITKTLNYIIDGYPYTRLEYIYAKKNMYIDTGIPITTDLTLEMEYELIEKDGGQCLFGESNGGWNVYADGFCSIDNNFGIAYTGYPQMVGFRTAGTDDSILAVNSGALTITNTHIVLNDVQYDANIDSSTSTPYDIFKSDGSNLLLLHNSHWGGWGKLKLFKVRISKAGELLMDLIPVIYKETGEAGMWNLVNETFLASDGTASFLSIYE